MKILVGITSCEEYEKNGENQAMRETCLQDALRLGIDYKFFHGREATPKDDVVIVDWYDGYNALVGKTIEKFKWILERPYEFVFCADCDTYFCAERLLTCGFEQYDYYGDFFHADVRQPWPHSSHGMFCQAGPGFFLSRKAVEYALPKMIDWLPQSNGSDFVSPLGRFIKENPSLKIGDDRRFTTMLAPEDIGPRKYNQIITAHLSTISENKKKPHGPYKPKYMYKKYQEWKDSE